MITKQANIDDSLLQSLNDGHATFADAPVPLMKKGHKLSKLIEEPAVKSFHADAALKAALQYDRRALAMQMLGDIESVLS